MSGTRIRITSLETPENFFVFEASTLALAVAKCVTELADVWTFAYDEELATLLKTIGEAIESDTKTAQEWDFSSPGDAYKVEIEEFTQLTDELICDLCIATTRDSTGAHFTQWLSSHPELEDLGLVKIDRPKHPGTGIPYGSDHWTLEVTEAGQAVVDSHPELHPGDTDHTEDNDHDSRKAGIEPIAPHQTISFVDPSGKNGLLDVDPADCRFDVSAVQCEGNRWRLTAEAHNTKDGGEDGWYAFLEGYQHNRKLGHFGAVFCHLNGWMFETAADALAMAQTWCKELGVQPKSDYPTEWHFDVELQCNVRWTSPYTTEIQDALSLQDNPAPVPGPKKITSVTQRIMHGDCRVTAKFDDGSTTQLFSYYIDELSFSDSEFIGLTQKEAMALRHKKDVAYLQS